MRNKNNENQKEQLLKLQEVSSLLSVHPNTLRNWDRDGILRAVRVGSRGDRRYRKSNIYNFIQKHHG